MELIEGIKSRRSIRKFTADPVSAADVEKVVDAARFSPTWKNTQVVRYSLVLNKEVKDKIADEAVLGFAHNTEIIKNAPTLVVVSIKDHISGYERDGSATTSQGDHWQSYDAGICSDAFCLAAYAYGLSTVILGIFDEAKVADLITLPEGQKVAALIPIGHADEAPQAPKKKEVSDLLRVVE
ncbi:MAG: nitroreductase family protein [Lachnospiraceae bacterium]|nr:nitroreductase family protein [Lachnospiraceae bacterium]